MKFFIFSMDTLNTTFSMVESGGIIKFELNHGYPTKHNFEEEIKDIEINDLILGYNKGLQTFKCLFKVQDISNGILIFEKVIDVSKGATIDDKVLKNRLDSEYFIELGLEEFNEIYSKLLNSIPLFDNIFQESYEDKFKSKKRNQIFFGAPGTGKSFTLNSEKDDLVKYSKSNYERVTFHPDYSYAHFVGTYKPVPKFKEGEEIISYEYVPGPFMRVLVKALKHKSEPCLLIIEEINRANVAAVFGDVFQLLDRNDNDESEFPIHASEDMIAYLKSSKGLGDDYDELIVNDEIKIPSNMFIWATMNSADQGVFMMDTAFKRRWDFRYIGINESSDIINNVKVSLGNPKKSIKWDSLRQAINKQLLKYGINEDKLLGPFFIPLKHLPTEKNNVSNEDFIEIFNNKVIMYLFEDVAKARRDDLFSGVKKDKEHLLYSDICYEFESKGIGIFSSFIKNCINELEK